ncbi:MAG TPA: hypothetical protein VFZ61_00175 [Polyangiales bacterium]
MHSQQRQARLLALSLGLAAGCFQPLDPYEPQGEEGLEDRARPQDPAAGGGQGPFMLDGSTPLPDPDARPQAMDAGVGSVAPSPAAAPPVLAGPGLPVPLLPPSLWDAGGPDLCQGLPYGLCEATQGCFASRLYALDYARNCTTAETRHVCARVPCGLFGTTLARDPGGQAFRVPVGCVPPDFAPLSTPSDPPSPPCPSAAAVAGCARHPDQLTCASDPDYACVAVSAEAYDPVRRCFGGATAASQLIRCLPYQAARGGPPGYFLDAQGLLWRAPADVLEAVPGDWRPIAASRVMAEAGAELSVCVRPLVL